VSVSVAMRVPMLVSVLGPMLVLVLVSVVVPMLVSMVMSVLMLKNRHQRFPRRPHRWWRARQLPTPLSVVTLVQPV
jgi:hypothetical protein